MLYFFMHYFKYIGNAAPESAMRSYILEVSKEEHKSMKNGANYFSGVVVHVNSRSPFKIGYTSARFTNPYKEMEECGFPVFVKVQKDHFSKD